MVGLDPLTSGEVVVAQNIAFGLIAVIMLFSALRMVTTRNVVHAALYLVIVLAGSAAIFILLGAEFVGVTQVLVYIGAIVVLFLFGIMLTRGALGVDEEEKGEQRLMSCLVAGLLAIVTAGALINTFSGNQPATTLGCAFGSSIHNDPFSPDRLVTTAVGLNNVREVY